MIVHILKLYTMTSIEKAIHCLTLHFDQSCNHRYSECYIYMLLTVMQKGNEIHCYWSSLYISPGLSKRRVCQCGMHVYLSRGIYWNQLWYNHHRSWSVMFFFILFLFFGFLFLFFFFSCLFLTESNCVVWFLFHVNFRLLQNLKFV